MNGDRRAPSSVSSRFALCLQPTDVSQRLQLLNQPGQEAVEIRVDRPDEALRILDAIPEVSGIARQDDFLIAELPVDLAGQINRELVLAGITVSELRPRQHGLEERFLALTDQFEQGGSS